MDHSRKRKLSEGAVASSSPPSKSKLAGGANESDNFHACPLRGHRYEAINASGQSKVHLGDSTTVNNYNSQSSREDRREERFESFVQSLGFEQMEFRRQTIDQAYADTCRWVFEKGPYLRWQDRALRASHHGFLWIKGKPGSGKSTMMKCILEHLQHETPKLAAISFFFNARGSSLERSIQGCYRSLLYQLLERLPRLRRTIRIPTFFTPEQEWPVATVRDLFRQAVLGLQDERLVLIIDALDECNEDEVRDMIEFVGGLARSISVVDTCFASRHYPRITVQYREDLVIEQFDSHERDVQEYINDKLNIRFENDAFREHLVRKMMTKAQGVFLWVVLVVRLANRQFDRGSTGYEISASVEALPDILDALIGRIISDGASDECLLPALIWGLIARGDMSLEELYIGTQLGAGKLTSPLRDSCSVDYKTMVRFILHASKGLLETAYSPQEACDPGNSYFPDKPHLFQFIHESVREHVLGGGLAALSPRLSSNVEAGSHAMAADWCFAYTQLRPTTLTEFPINSSKGTIAWQMLLRHFRGPERQQTITALPFLRYAYFSAFYHINSAYSGQSYDLKCLQSFPVRDWIDISNLYMSVQSCLYVPSASLLHLLLESEHCTSEPSIITGLLEEYTNGPKTARREHGTTTATDEYIMRDLVGSSVDDYCGGCYGTPLVAAVGKDLSTYVQSLLDLGADINAPGQHIGPSGKLEGRGETPLSAASRGRTSTEMMELLLHHGANVNGLDRTNEKGNALATASRVGNVVKAELLLGHGADVSLEDSEGSNVALKSTLKSPYNQERMVKFLLDHGACATPQASDRALHIAAKACRDRYIEMFVEAGADPNGRDSYSRTGLHIISEGCKLPDLPIPICTYSRIVAAKALLRLGADVNAVGGEYDTPLIAAAANGFDQLVLLFLGHGADTSRQSKDYGTAFEAARNAGHCKIFEILSETHDPKSELTTQLR